MLTVVLSASSSYLVVWTLQGAFEKATSHASTCIIADGAHVSMEVTPPYKIINKSKENVSVLENGDDYNYVQDQLEVGSINCEILLTLSIHLYHLRRRGEKQSTGDGALTEKK